MKTACRAPIRARIATILATKYQLESVPPSSTRLGELALDSLSLLGFLVELEREFKLQLDELRAIARRDIPIGHLIELCHVASLRDDAVVASF